MYLPSELNLAAGRFVLRTVEAADSKADDVLQIADLLTGSAFSTQSPLPFARVSGN